MRRLLALLLFALTQAGCDDPPEQSVSGQASATAEAPIADARATSVPPNTTGPEGEGEGDEDWPRLTPVKAEVSVRFVQDIGGELMRSIEGETYHLGPPLITQDDIEGAAVSLHPYEDFEYVHLTLTEEGTRALERITTENVGHKLAIVVEGEVIIAPVIREAITVGRISVDPGLDSDPDFAQKLFETLTQ